jgi:hypothetical protein
MKIVVSKLTQKKSFFECNVKNFFKGMKDLEKEMHFNEYWNDLIMNQLPILFPMVFINIQDDDLSVVRGPLFSKR